MSPSESHSAEVLALAEEFLERYRQGQRPSLKEYADRHPDLADVIHEVFPAMAMMENIAIQEKSLAGDRTEAPDGQVPRPLLPEQFGDFRIIREIGHGGMGVVYEAEQVSLGRHVALKILPPQMVRDRKQRLRFEREAKAAAKLHHTNIVPVFGVGEHEGTAYYAMQYIPGLGLDIVIEELKKIRPEGPGGSSHGPQSAANGALREVSAAAAARSLLTGRFEAAECPADPTEALLTEEATNAPIQDPPALWPTGTSSSSVVLPGTSLGGDSRQGGAATYWQSVARIGRQVAEALDYAHWQGILHRDIKPSNLLLDTQGTVWVTDFGLAKIDDQQNLTHTGDLLGTLRYMPPEAFEGKSDARSEVYSLGLTLYEMLAYRPAFDQNDRGKLISQVMHEEPMPLGQVNRKIPRDLVTIVHKAIARQPAQRYPSAGALADDLGRFIEGRPIRARRVSATERTWRWCKRNPVITGMLVVLVAALTAVVGLWLRSDRLLALTRHQAVGLQLDQAITLCEQGYLDRGLLAMAEQLRDYASSPTEEQHAIRANLAAWSPRLITFDTPASGVYDGGVPLDSNGKEYVAVDGEGTPQFWDPATGKAMGPRFEPAGALRMSSPERTRQPPKIWFSRQWNSLLGLGGDGCARAWDRATGRLLGPPIEVPAGWSFLELSEDRGLLAAGTRYDLKRWDVRTGRPITTSWSRDPAQTEIVVLTTRRVITRDSNWVFRLYNLDTGKLVGHPLPCKPMTYCVFWPSTKPDVVVMQGVLDQGGWFQWWNTETGDPLGPRWSVTGNTPPRLATPLAPPAGSSVVIATGDTITVRDLATGKQQGEGMKAAGTIKRIGFFTVDQKMVVVETDAGAQVWEIPTRRLVGKTLKIFESHRFLAVSANAARVVVAGDPGDLHTGANWGLLEVWDVGTGRRLLDLDPEWKATGLALDATGTSLMFCSGDHVLHRCDLPGKVLDREWVDNEHAARLTISDRPPALRYQVKELDGSKRLLEAVDNETLTAAGPPMSFASKAQVSVCSPRDDLILTGCVDGSALLWSPKTGTKEGVVMRHPQTVSGATFSPDGRIIATAAGRTARLWDVALCRLIGPPMELDQAIKGVSFSTDGRWLVVRCDDKGAYRWPVPAPMEGDASQVMDRVKKLTSRTRPVIH